MGPCGKCGLTTSPGRGSPTSAGGNRRPCRVGDLASRGPGPWRVHSPPQGPGLSLLVARFLLRRALCARVGPRAPGHLPGGAAAVQWVGSEPLVSADGLSPPSRALGSHSIDSPKRPVYGAFRPLDLFLFCSVPSTVSGVCWGARDVPLSDKRGAIDRTTLELAAGCRALCGCEARGAEGPRRGEQPAAVPTPPPAPHAWREGSRSELVSGRRNGVSGFRALCLSICLSG